MRTSFSRFNGCIVFALVAMMGFLGAALAPTRGVAAALANVLVNNPNADATARDSQLESALVLGVGNTILSAYVDTGSWDGVAGGANDHFIGLSLSFDGGATWMDQGALPDSIRGDGLNPSLARGFGIGSLGDTIYLATTDFDTTAFSGSTAIQVFRFQNTGIAFMGGPSTIGAVAAPSRVQKPSIAVDNFPGPALGQANVYLAWSVSTPAGSSIQFASSTDGGNSFAAPITVSAGAPFNANAPVVVVGADHTVYVFWLEQAAGGAVNTIKMRRSINQGTSFVPAFPNATFLVTTLNAANTRLNGDLKLQGGFAGNSFPQPAANPVPANAANLYLAFNDVAAAAGDRADVFLLQSANNGVAWTPGGPGAGGRVNDDPVTSLNDQFGPALAITPDGTGLFVGFYDRRRDPANYLIDTFGRIASINLAGVASFLSPSFRITTESFPPVTDQDPGLPNVDPFSSLGDFYMGSHEAAVADSGFFYYSWNDNRLAHDFAPGGSHANQPDVRFAKIPVLGPGGILDLNTEAVPGGGVAITGGNGNGVIDFNECNNLAVTLINRGSANIVGISATLESLTPGVVVSQGASLYPDIGPGLTGTGAMPFSIATRPEFVCGTIVALRLTVMTANAGPFTIPIRLNSGMDGPSVNVQSLDTFPIPIPDNDGTVSSLIHVFGSGAPISSLKVRLWITHTFDADLDISLVGPDGTSIVLSSDNGGSFNDYGTAIATPTVFDDGAATGVIFGTAPFAGAFRPEQPLRTFVGKPADGNWTLRVRDDAAADIGAIQYWSLDIGTAVCADGGGMCLQVAGTQVTGGNGNGRLDPNECASLSVILTNIRPVAFLGVTSKLVSLTPGVVVTRAVSAYPDIPGTGSLPPAKPYGTNLTPFKVSIPAGFPCGGFVNFVLKVTAANDGTFDVPFRLQVGSCSPNPAFVSTDVPKAIPDLIAPGGLVESTITVSGITAPIGKVNVSVGIVHGNVSQLTLKLTAPDGTVLTLAPNPDGGGDNFGSFTTLVPPFTCLVPTLFDDAAGVSIMDGVPPYAGAFVPSGPVVPGPGVPPPIGTPGPLFAAFSDKPTTSVNGVWKLTIMDNNLPLESGQLVCWSLSICEPKQFMPNAGALPAAVADGGFNDVFIPVSGITGPINKIRLSTRITHAATADLDISLIGPDGTTVNLSSDNSGANPNFGVSGASPTVFDDDAGASITSTLANTPLAFANGQFRPEEPLAAFAGKSGAAVNGAWRLHVVDDTVNAMPGVVNTVLLEIFAASCTDGGGVCPPVRTLTVDALGTGGAVSIAGTDPAGPFTLSIPPVATRTYDNLTALSLTAPPNAPNGNTFVVWRIDGVAQTPGALTVPVTMNADHTVVAVYSGPLTLTVNALNAGPLGASITVNPPPNGVTPFSRPYLPLTLVTLTAQSPAPNGFVFLRWLIDGSPQPLHQATILVAMNMAHTVVAVYESPFRTLRVESKDPDSGVHVSGQDITHAVAFDGLTTFSRDFLTGSQVSLTAPALAPDGSLFKHWEVDGHNLPNGVLTINVLMDVSHEAQAEYESATVKLTVKSQDPDSGVSISGGGPGGAFAGLTTFTRVVNRYTSVQLLAPPSAGGHLFKRWEVNSDDQPKFLQTVTIFMDDDITAEAEFDGDVTGGIPYALWFDGFDDRVTVPDSSSLRITGSITVEALIKRELGGVEQTIVEKSGCPGEAPAVGGYALSVTSADKLRFQTKDSCSVANSVVGVTSLQRGLWYHVAGVWDGSQLKVYVNGVQDGVTASTSNPKLGNTPLLIGSSGNVTPQTVFAGTIDELRVWSVARTQPQIAGNPSACLTGTEPGLAGYWRFNEKNTMVAHDSTPNLNNGMLANGPIWVDSSTGCTNVASPAPFVAARPAPVPSAVGLGASILRDLSSRSSQIIVKGPPGQEVVVEVSGDLVRWAPLECVTNTTGAFQLSNPMDPGASKRFFRVRPE